MYLPPLKMSNLQRPRSMRNSCSWPVVSQAVKTHNTQAVPSPITKAKMIQKGILFTS